MSSAKERLGQLLALAAEHRWTVLAQELAALTLDWPRDWPEAMRPPAMALFELAARECDEPTRADIAARMGGHAEMPLRLLNELYLAAPAPLRREILMRNQLECEDAESGAPADAAAIITAARTPGADFAGTLSRACAIPRDIARTILSDALGEPLAVLCLGSGLDRATFSAIVLLRGAAGLPLSVFDTVPVEAARRLTRQWQTHHVENPYADHMRAAE